jgi:CPA1 family monovalent cation:H+ antiporter
LVANISQFVSKKVGFPYSILLVLTGALLHLGRDVITVFKDFALTPELLFFIFLPPLLFESAFHLDFRKLKKDALVISVFATAGVVLTALVVGLGLYSTLGIPFWISLLFAAIISSTDPIAVIAIFKDIGVPKRLLQMLDTESMLNDGTSIIFSKIILSILSVGFAGESLIWTGANFIYVVLGAVFFGGLVAILATYFIKRLKNEMLIEVTITLLVAFTTFIVAEEFLQVSGVVATVASGIFLGNIGIQKFSPRVKHFVTEFWEYVAFIANSFVFLLVGLTFGFELVFTNYTSIIIAYLLVLAGRAFSIYSLSIIYNKFAPENKIPATWMHVLNWGGLRGALPIAVVLALPENVAYKAELLTITVGVVILSLVINGLSIKLLLRFLKVDEPSLLEKAQSEIAKTMLLSRSRKHINLLNQIGEISSDSDKKFDITYQKKINSIFSGIKEFSPEQKECNKQAIYHMAFQIEKEVFIKLYEKGVLTEKILNKLKEKLEEGLDLIESGIYPEEFSKNKVMKALSEKSKKGFSLKELFLYRKAREFANLEVIQELSVFADIPVLKDLHAEIISTYNKLISKNRKMCNDLVSGDPEKIQQYEQDLCYTEFLAMEENLFHNLQNQGKLSLAVTKILHKAIE